MKLRVRNLVWVAVLAALGVGLWRAFGETPVIVDAGAIHLGELRVTVDDDGRTRVRDRFTIHAPVRGRLLRTPLEAGDAVARGETLVAEFEPVSPDLLDERSLAEAEARRQRALAAIDESRARLEQGEAEAAYAAARRTRVAELVQRGIESADTLDLAERDARARSEAVNAARFALRVAEFEAEVAAAALLEPVVAANGDTPPRDRVIVLLAPIDGAVLRVFEESTRPVAAGAPLVELGDVHALEVVADYLSQDAVKVRPGMPARLVGWGGETADGRPAELEARVRVVEPSGYTKISALGVEEQRVDVVLDPVGDPSSWARLADGYRVDVRIETWHGDRLLLIPTGALFRSGDRWAAFVVDPESRAELRPLRIGRRTGLEAEVLDGLAEGETVILYPSAMVESGTLVERR